MKVFTALSLVLVVCFLEMSAYTTKRSYQAYTEHLAAAHLQGMTIIAFKCSYNNYYCFPFLETLKCYESSVDCDFDAPQIHTDLDQTACCNTYAVYKWSSCFIQRW